VPLPVPIREHLLSAAWEARFDDFVRDDGAKLARKRRVRELDLRQADDGGGVLTAQVEDLDGEFHEVEIALWPEPALGWDLDASCSCPYAHFCQHAAAVLFTASKTSVIDRLLDGEQVRPARPATRMPKPAVSPPPEDAPARITGLRPAFHLEVGYEPANSRTVQLLLQSLRARDRDRWLVARPTAHYGGHDLPLPAATDSEHPVDSAHGPLVVERDRPAERAAIEALLEVGLTHLGAQPSYRFLLGVERRRTGEPAPEAGAWFPEPNLSTPGVYWPWFRAEAVPKLEARGWTVHIDPGVGHPVHLADPDAWDSAIEKQPGGWFALSVGFDLDGRRLDLLPILAGLLKDDTLDQLSGLPETARHLVYLPDGGALHIPAGRLRRILRHLALFVDPDKPLLHPLDAAALAERSDLPLDPPPALAELAARLDELKAPPLSAPPAGVRATLRDYQLAGFRWMQSLAAYRLHGLLADDMGLGKTLQTLSHLLEEKTSGRSDGRPSLVVAPTSVVPNWQSERARFTPSLRVLVLHGPQRRRHFNAIPHADLVLTSYALLQRDIEHLEKVPFHLAVLDEAQHIKNPRAKVAQAARRLDARHRLCLTGTPVENHLGELWSLMSFLIPGFLGSRRAFRERFQTPIEKDHNEERLADLKERLAPLVLRRTKDEVASELPPKTVLVHHIELTTGQKDLYETVRAAMHKEVRDAIAARGLAQSRILFLDALLKLRQICCHPALLPQTTIGDTTPGTTPGTTVPAVTTPPGEAAGNTPGPARPGEAPPSPAGSSSHRDPAHPADPASAKLAYLLELLEVLLEEGRRILLFSQFTSMLALIAGQLRKLGIPYIELTGASRDRGALVDRFQRREVPLFLISLKAGGAGLNLTAADTVIHYDPWWNPAVETQASDRAHRIGQTRPVFVHKLICSGTVEEKIRNLQTGKARLAAGLLAGASHAPLDPESLRTLLGPPAEDEQDKPRTD